MFFLKVKCSHVRKPICDIVFCVMLFLFRCFDFLLSCFVFLVYAFCVPYDVVHFKRRNSRGRDRI